MAVDYLLYYDGFVEMTVFDDNVSFVFRDRDLKITVYFDEEVHVFIDIIVGDIDYSVKVEGKYIDVILDMLEEIINDSIILYEGVIE